MKYIYRGSVVCLQIEHISFKKMGVPRLDVWLMNLE